MVSYIFAYSASRRGDALALLGGSALTFGAFADRSLAQIARLSWIRAFLRVSFGNRRH